MPFEAGSLEDVEAWAQHEFPIYFAALSTFALTVHLHTKVFDSEYTDGKIVFQPTSVLALEVGSTKVGDTVYARITGSDDVELFYGRSPKSEYPRDADGLLSCITPVEGLDGIELVSTFACCTETGHPAGVDRIEALIRYFFLKGGMKIAVQLKLGFFKTHFRGACREVARVTGNLDGPVEAEEDDTLPANSPPGLLEDTDIDRFHHNATATAVFDEHAHAMDEIYHDFKTSVLRQLGTIQIVDRENMAQLHAQNQDLVQRLAATEKDKVDMSKELATEKLKAKTALDEAERWKAQYEGLKGTLQGALGQQF